MRKAFAKLLMADVKLTNNEQHKYAKGKIMFSNSAASLSINKQMTLAEGTAITQNNIIATHYYIKFMPANEADYYKLKADSNLVIYPFPLDVELSPYSGNYRDPSVPLGVPTYQYAAIPVGYILPNVPYQKLEDLFIPDELNNSMVTAKGANGSYFSVAARTLSEESICGSNENGPIGGSDYEELPTDDCDGGGGGSYPPNDPYRNGENWKPHGRLTVYDEVKGAIVGVKGVNVRARRWFTTYDGLSDSEGYYAVDGWFTRPANYWLNFERYQFSVNDHGGGPREVDGPKQEAAWDVEFTGYDKFCSTIFRAADHYYYNDIQGLRRPPQNGFFNTQMKLGAYDQSNSSNGDHSPFRRLFGIGEAIHIYNPNRRIDDIYATTIHELAHAVHWELDKNAYFASTLNVSESWSTGVQWVLTKMEYPNYYGRPNGTPNYTNLVMDLIDPPGVVYYQIVSGGYYEYGTGSPTDEVGGYSIAQIEEALIGATDFSTWKSNLKFRYENNTEQHLDALFNHWTIN